jgi:hypothetical protein
MKKMGFALILIVKENEVKQFNVFNAHKKHSLIYILTFDVKKEYDYNRII